MDCIIRLFYFDQTFKTNTMKTQQEKAEILEMAEDFRMVDECNESEIKSDFFYLRKAMSWKPVAEKRSNKLSECMGRHNEVMNQRYNHNTRSYEKF